MSFDIRPLREDPKPKRSVWKPIGLWALRLSGPLMEVGHLWREQREKRMKEERRTNLLKRILVILVTLFCAALLFAGTAKALIALKIVSLHNIIGIAGTPLPVDAYGHTNILLLGQGDESHDGVDLTDTIMIASIDPTKTKSAVMLSLPRDLYFLETENMGAGRINSLYRDYKIKLEREGFSVEEASQAAMRELANEIGIATGIEIHHIVKVDFIGFVQVVDAIGGVDVFLPEALEDPEYPGPNYTYETFSLPAGAQHLDGDTALKYARSRHSTSDFDRSRRQQEIIQAIGDKMKAENLLTRPGQIAELLDILSEHVETDLQLRDMVTLAGAGKELDRSKIISVQLNVENGLYGAFSQAGGLLYNPPRDQFGGAAVLLPVSIPEDPVTWDRLRFFVELLVHRRDAYVENAPIRIYNAGAEAGSARQIGGELIRFGFNVVSMENEPNDLESPTSRIEGREDSKTYQLLTELLPQFPADPIRVAPVSSAASTSSAAEVQPDVITIELGEDFEYAPIMPTRSAGSPFRQ